MGELIDKIPKDSKFALFFIQMNCKTASTKAFFMLSG